MRRYSTESERLAIPRAQRAVRELRGETVPFHTKFWAAVLITGVLVACIVLS